MQQSAGYSFMNNNIQILIYFLLYLFFFLGPSSCKWFTKEVPVYIDKPIICNAVIDYKPNEIGGPMIHHTWVIEPQTYMSYELDGISYFFVNDQEDFEQAQLPTVNNSTTQWEMYDAESWVGNQQMLADLRAEVLTLAVYYRAVADCIKRDQERTTIDDTG